MPEQSGRVTTQPTFGQVVVIGLAVGTFPLAAAALLLSGPVAAGAVLAFGWLLAVPLVALLASSMGILTRDDERETAMAGAGDEELDPLEALKDRYARGEIDDAEFDRRLDRLVELDGVEVPDELGPEALDPDPTASDPAGEGDGEAGTDDAAEDREPAFER